MTEEYVYKIVVDDAEIKRTLDRVDQRIKTMGVAADKSFAGIGTKMTAGLRQTEQASQRTTQQMVQGQQKVMAARQRSLTEIDKEIAAMEKKRAAAERAAQSERRAIEQGTQALQEMRQERQRAQAEEEAFRRTGATRVDPGAIDQVTRATVGRETTLEAGLAERAPTAAAAEEELQSTTEAYDQLVERRAAMTEEIAQSAQTQQEAETTASQTTSESIMSGLNERQQAAVSTAQAELQSAQAVVAEKQRVVAAAREEVVSAKAATDAARVGAAQKGADAKTAAAEIEAVSKQEIRARREVTEATKAGNKDEIAAAQEKRKALTARLEDLEKEKQAAKTAQAEQQAGIAELVQSENMKKQAVTEASEAVKVATNQEKEARRALTAETKRASQEQTKSARRQRQGEAAFKSTTKTYNKQRNQLHELAKQYGSFNVVLGKTSGSLSQQEKEVQDIIRSDKQLEAEIEKLIAKYGELNIAVNRSTFKGGRGGGVAGTGIQGQQFRQAGFAAQRFGIPGAAVLGEAAIVGGGAGIAIAGVLLSVQALTKAFIGVGKAAVSAFASVASSGMEAAKEMEIASAQFKAFFQGDTQASEAAMNRLLDLSKELGENVVGVGRAFLPEVENLDQLEEVVKSATALARFQPEQGIMGARIALQEALGGEFRSLQRRFEISPVAIDKIREAFQATGVTGFLEELQAELSRTGRSVEDLSDTWGVAMGKVKERLRQVTAELGKPVVDEYKEQLKGIGDELQRLDPDLKLIANAFGEVLAKIVDIIGTEIQSFLKNFDPQPLLDLAESAFRVVAAIELIIGVVGPGEMAAGSLGLAAQGLSGLLLDLAGWFLKVGSKMNDFRADFKDTILDVVNVLRTMSRAYELTTRVITLNTAWWLDTADSFNDQLDELAWSLEMMEDLEPFDWAEKLVEYEMNVQDFNEGLIDMATFLNRTGDAGEGAANAFMTYTQATQDARIAAEMFAEAQDKVNEVLGEFQIAADIKFEKLATNVARQALDDEIAAQRKLIDIEIKNREKIASIREKFDQSIIDAGQELGDREADIARKSGDALLDLEEDLADKRIEIEEDYFDSLERLRDKFNFDANEAIRDNDATRLQEIRRRQAFEEAQARKERDKKKKDVEVEGKDRRGEQEKQRGRELRDAQIVNARKIRDLQQSLEQQLEAQEESRKQDLANAVRAEERKRNDLQMSLDRQLDDYRAWWIERNRVTQEKVAEDKALAQEMAQNWQDAQDKIAGIGLPGLGTPLQQPGPFASGYVFPQDVGLPAPGAPTGPDAKFQDEVRQQIVDIQFALAREEGDLLDKEALDAAVSQLSLTDLVEELDTLQGKLDSYTQLKYAIQLIPVAGLLEKLEAPAPFDPASIGETPEIAALRQQTIELSRLLIESTGLEGFRETERATRLRVGDLSLEELVREISRVQDFLITLQPTPPEFEAVDTTDLFEHLLTQQARLIAEALGIDAAEEEEKVAGLNAEEIQTHIDFLLRNADELIAEVAATAADAPAAPAITTTPAGMVSEDDETTPVTVVTPSGQPIAPGFLAARPPEEAAEPDEPTQDVTATEAMGQEADLPEGSEFLGVGGALGLAWFNVPDDAEEEDDEPTPVTIVTPSGQPTIPFGIAAPAPAEDEEGAPTTIPEIVSTTDLLSGMDRDEPIPVTVVTPAGQAIITNQQGDNVPTPLAGGGFLQPTDPSEGVSAAGIMDAINAEVEALATAELEKVGEIEDLAKHAELMAEAKLLATTMALDEEVGAYKTASDEEIAILESTLATHQAALAAIGGDPMLAADAAVLETSIGVLNDTLERLRAEQLAATEDALSDEVTAVEDAEKEKVILVDETSALISLAYLDRETAIAAGLLKEVAETEKATKAETELVRRALEDQGEAVTERRAEELEEAEEHEGEKSGLFMGAHSEHLADLHSFWIKWLAENNTAMQADLTQLFQWVQERQKMFALSIQFGSGFGSIGGGIGGLTTGGTSSGADDTDTPSAQPTLQDLQGLATAHATTLGSLEQYQSLISSLPYDDLAALVFELQDMVNAKGMALGGGVTPGYRWVGEEGRELVRFNQAARIDPAALFRNQPAVGISSGNTSIDQSVSNQFSFPDPRGIPPTYIATMENIAAKVIEKSLRR